MKSAEPFPWKEAMGFGFGVLRLSSKDFWSMTVRELEAAMQAHFGTSDATVSRQWLRETMEKNPDQKQPQERK